MNETLARQPNYTCVEQIERGHRRPPKFRHELLDVLRLEVALVNGKELYAWPGSRKFDEQDLEKIVPRGGAIGNGNFALFSRGVFESSAPVFEYKGLEPLDGKQAVRYNYKVPQFQSGFNLKVNNQSAIVGFHGSFWADPESHDVLRLEVIADDIPPSMGLESAITSMEYSRMKIGEGDFLLPSGSELTMTHYTGAEDRNRMRFTACRQYAGESVLSFGEAPTNSAVETPVSTAKETVNIPAEMAFEIAIDAEIASENSMVGDQITATLRQNIKREKQTLFAKGATLTGRIIRLERHVDHCVLDLHFDEIEAEDRRGTLNASVEAMPVGTSGSLGVSRMMQGEVHSNDTGALLLKGNRFKLPKGYRIRLHTQAELTPGNPDTAGQTVRK